MMNLNDDGLEEFETTKKNLIRKEATDEYENIDISDYVNGW